MERIIDYTSGENVYDYQIDQIYIWKAKVDWHIEAGIAYGENLDDSFESIKPYIDDYEYTIVIYDESEKFYDYNEESFNYPYESRIIRSGSYTFRDVFESNDDDYSYDFADLNFRLSQVCLESPPEYELGILFNAFDKFMEFFRGIEIQDSSVENFECPDGSVGQFEKLVYESY